MFNFIIIALLVFLPFCGFSITLKEKFISNSLEESLGYFIVTEHQKNLSFIRAHSIDPPFLFIEEINIPRHLIGNQQIDWANWLKKKAPNHTSWLLYRIDLQEGKMMDCYSFSRESYIAVSEQNSFLATLMLLNLEEVPMHDRKKIGPKPPQDMPDTRKLWNPSKIYEGKKIPNAHFMMMRTKWPKDDTDLAGRWIDLYFDEDQPKFPFPYWVEIGDGHNVFKLQVIDSGKNLYFPFRQQPVKTPKIHRMQLSQSEGLDIQLEDAYSLKNFQIIATQTSKGEHISTLLPHQYLIKEGKPHLHIDYSALSLHLKEHCHYTLTIIPIDHPSLTLESPFSFKTVD